MSTILSEKPSNTCPPWCSGNHRREQCHFSLQATFAATDDRRFRVGVGRDPGDDKSDLVYLDDVDGGALNVSQLEGFPMECVPAFVAALQWARRTARSTGPEGSHMNAALSLSESIGTIVDATLTNSNISDEQRRDVLVVARSQLVDVLAAAENG